MAKSGKAKANRSALQQVQHTARTARTALAARLLESGLYAGQDQIMLALADGKPLTPTALAQALNVRPPTITKTINRLQSQGFLEKAPSQSDGRQAEISLTEKGRDTIEAISKSVKRTEKKALKGIDKKELKAAIKTLAKIAANLADFATGADAGTAEDDGADEA